ncbi:MAG: Thiopurine S-methyltransferase (EC [uncultured Sulfurovum sp.]|uniref:Thiopurine S-methyltransferase n=1 Tax=uncultured Sulfurovum sp. TaxID=269237 RepID=A0A6S6SD82_9BACT|nr:MAG: Thiopurine S-methyltransferase (EC [uncultured Sulfurovum sp.]
MKENTLWLERWKNREIGFNQESENPFMVKYFKHLNLQNESRILVPLCGKTIDIAWLLSEGYAVAGVELSEQAVIELFEELDIVPTVSNVGELKLYSTEKLHVYVGDIFKLNSKILGKVDAIYDRAALVALSTEVRLAYTQHLRELSNHAPQLLLCFEYDQSLMNRTPYSVEESEVRKHYEEHYDLELLTREEIDGGFKGKLPACDVAWLLK